MYGCDRTLSKRPYEPSMRSFDIYMQNYIKKIPCVLYLNLYIHAKIFNAVRTYIKLLIRIWSSVVKHIKAEMTF